MTASIESPRGTVKVGLWAEREVPKMPRHMLDHFSSVLDLVSAAVNQMPFHSAQRRRFPRFQTSGEP